MSAYPFKIAILLLIFMMFGVLIQATELKVAVASNFLLPAEQIKKLFEAETQHKLNIISGSSGKHFAQIINGAPFDVFLAADSSYISKLEEQQLIEPGTKWQYAKGKLVLVLNRTKNLDLAAIKKLFAEHKLFTSAGFKKLQFSYFAIANPDLAPYGRAAKELLEKLEVYPAISTKLVVGENILQAQQFVVTGNAEMGLLSLAQVILSQEQNLYFTVPEKLYTPIVQEAVVLKSSLLNNTKFKNLALDQKVRADIKAAKAFVDFLKTPKVKKLIQGFGYDTL